jgi:hypothetical protein
LQAAVAVAVALLGMPMVVLVVVEKELAAPARWRVLPERLTTVVVAAVAQTLANPLIKDGQAVLVWLLFLIHLPLMTLHQLVAV